MAVDISRLGGAGLGRGAGIGADTAARALDGLVDRKGPSFADTLKRALGEISQAVMRAKCCARSGMSSARSRSGGTSTGTVFSL